MNNFDKPYYEANFEYIYPFKKEGDLKTKFIETIYYIRREFFEPKELGSEMPNICAGASNQSILAIEGAQNDIDDFVLLKESTETSAIGGDSLKVTQIWGVLGDYYTSYAFENPLYAEFNNASVVWLNTVRYVFRANFESRINDYDTALSSIILSSGDDIIDTQLNSFSTSIENYYLLSEQVENTEYANIAKITETWGYCPDITFTSGGVVGWTRPAIVSYADGGTQICSAPTASGGLVSLGIDAPVGSTVNLWRNSFDEPSIGTFAGMSASGVQIIGANGLTSADVTFSLTDGSTENTFFATWADATHPSARYAFLEKTVINANSRDFSASIVTSFIATSQPMFDADSAYFQVKLGDSPSDEISEYTTPSISSFSAMCADNEKIIPNMPTYSKIKGNIWRIDTSYIKAQM